MSGNIRTELSTLLSTVHEFAVSDEFVRCSSRRRELNSSSQNRTLAYRKGKFGMAYHVQQERSRYREIYVRIRDSIANGKVRRGERLPSTRALAAELSVARGTVDAAYAMLAAEGYVESSGRHGTVVLTYRSNRPRMEPSRQQSAAAGDNIEDTKSRLSSPRPLTPGQPSYELFPRKLWSRFVAREVRKKDVANFFYPDPLGNMRLREALSSHLAVTRGIQAQPEKIIITGGYSASQSILGHLFLKPGDQVWVEAPGPVNALQAVQAVGGTPVPVTVDKNGIDVDEGILRAPNAAMCVTTPAGQFPLGYSMSLERRRKLLDWAREKQSWIVEHDCAGRFSHAGCASPSLKSMDVSDRVFHAGAFSNTFIPSLCLGYLIAPPQEHSRVEQYLRRTSGGLLTLEQAAMAEFIAEGHFFRHARNMMRFYTSRMIALKNALDEELGDRFQVIPAEGGLQLTLLADGIDDVALEKAAASVGLGPLALSRFMHGARSRSGLVIGFANLPEREAPATIGKLARAIRGSISHA
jgi:GntR family transcriptional regulator/MocR family aminotransferase